MMKQNEKKQNINTLCKQISNLYRLLSVKRLKQILVVEKKTDIKMIYFDETKSNQQNIIMNVHINESYIKYDLNMKRGVKT